METAWVSVARVLRPHGLRGALKVELWCEGLERLRTLRAVYLGKPGEVQGPFSVKHCAPHPSGAAVLTLAELTRLEEAQAFRGAWVMIPEKESVPAPEGSLYVQEWIGLAVVQEDGSPIGRVAALLEHSAHWVLAVKSERGEILVPLVKEVVRNVDRAAGRITVRLPESVEEG